MPRFAMDGLQPLIEEMTRMGEASGDGGAPGQAGKEAAEA